MGDRLISLNAALGAIDANNGILYDNPTLVESLRKLLSGLPPAPQIPWDKNTRNNMVFTLQTVLTHGDMDAIDEDNIKRLSRWLEGGEP